jgi:DNA (cytosine-5)-methyltransferase 1
MIREGMRVRGKGGRERVAPDAVTLDVTDQAPGALRGHATNAPAGSVTPGHGSKPPFGHTSTLVLSLFPGIDLMGRGFEQEGYCVVRGPDLIFGGDVRAFHPPPGRFDGIIGGSPCQDFSTARRCPPTGYGVEMLHEFCRCVAEAWPDWFLLENVPGVPDVQVPGYVVQRFDLRADECGLPQRRLRHFQFGSHGYQLVLRRDPRIAVTQRCVTATEGTQQERRDWGDFCEIQGLPRDFQLDGFHRAARYRAVGNGVPVPMARFIARAIRCMVPTGTVRLCECGCGRPLDGMSTQRAATDACRKRLQRRRDRAAQV